MPDHPMLDEALVQRAYDLSNGQTIHDLNALVGIYRNSCSRLATIMANLANPEWAKLKDEYVADVLVAETNLRAWISKQNADRASNYQP